MFNVVDGNGDSDVSSDNELLCSLCQHIFLEPLWYHHESDDCGNISYGCFLLV